MKVTIVQTGGKAMLEIPEPVLDQLDGRTEVDLEFRETLLIVAPAPSGKLTLKELVASISPDNRSEETDWGSPVGREIW